MAEDWNAGSVQVRPLPITPRFLRRLRAQAGKQGLAQAFAGMCQSKGILVRTVGDTRSWAPQGHGVILLADHRLTVEALPLLCLMGQLERNDLHAIVALHSIQARAFAALSQDELVLPVLPYRRAVETRRMWRLPVRYLRWHASRSDGLSQSNVRRFNHQTLARAAQLAASGHVVMVCPAGGGVADALTHPWQRGIGTIIQALSPAAQESVHIVPVRLDDFPRWRLAAALSWGSPDRPLEITVRVGRAGTAREMLGAADTIASSSAEEITGALRSEYARRLA